MDGIEAIRQLKARYFRLMDTKDWDGMRQVFTDDVVIDTSEAGGDVVSGADKFMTFLREALGDAVTVHHGHMPEIDITSDTTATGIWALNDIIVWPTGIRLDGYGHYHETYEKVDGEWRRFGDGASSAMAPVCRPDRNCHTLRWAIVRSRGGRDGDEQADRGGCLRELCAR
jgi:hypothetical protein